MDSKSITGASVAVALIAAVCALAALHVIDGQTAVGFLGVVLGAGGHAAASSGKTPPAE
jgi:hypothetical protein